MKRHLAAAVLTLIASSALADNISGVDRLLCSTSKIVICFESGECAEMQPWEINVPQFIIIDLQEKTLSTTEASGENRSSPIRSLQKEDGLIILQGFEAGRAFSYVIDEATGISTVSVARDGASIGVFGACTDADL